MFRYIILLFILVSCNLEPNNLAESKITNNEVHFDAVEKKIIFNQEVPLEFNSLLQSWYSKNIKLSGLNGKLFIYIDTRVHFIIICFFFLNWIPPTYPMYTIKRFCQII